MKICLENVFKNFLWKKKKTTDFLNRFFFFFFFNISYKSDIKFLKKLFVNK